MAMQQPPTTLDEHRNSGPIHRLISDHGQTFDEASLTYTSLAGQLVTVSDTLSETKDTSTNSAAKRNPLNRVAQLNR